MKNQLNELNNQYQANFSNYTGKNYHSVQKKSSKLIHSQSLNPSDLTVASDNQPKTQFTATQLYHNLNNSLEGLFSKIQALKQEHTIQQKAPPKLIKKFSMDVSNFPMPKLQSRQLKFKKPLGFPTLGKAKERRQQQNDSTKAFQQINQDQKAVSPPTQSYNSKIVSDQYILTKQQLLNNQIPVINSKKLVQNLIPETNSYRLVQNQQNQRQQSPFKKNNIKKGLLNIQTAQMKISMQVKKEFQIDQNSTTGQSQLRLDKIIEKQTQQIFLAKNSIVFNQCKLKDFQLGKNVGSGKFGDVHICRHRETGLIFALKKIFKSTILDYNMIDQFTRQLKIHYRLDHPNIIKLYTHFDDEFHIFLLMEYAQSGILMNKVQCTEDIASRYVQQTIDALQYLHKLKIAHRDIKPENIVIQFSNVIKLCDFGWASYYENQMKTTFCGTLDYISPQMKQGGQYDNSVDIWSIGVLTYQLLTGKPPYRKQLMLSMKNGSGPSQSGSHKINWTIKYPSYMSPLAESFIRNLLKENPDERASLRYCSTHTFIKKYQQDQQILPYYDQFYVVITNKNQSSQRSLGNDYLMPGLSPKNTKNRPVNTFTFIYNTMDD